MNDETRLCQHCSRDISIRNPSGYCDHLYYPEGCNICSGRKSLWKQILCFLGVHGPEEKFKIELSPESHEGMPRREWITQRRCSWCQTHYLDMPC